MQYNKFSLIFLILVFLLGCSDQKTVSTSSEDYNCNIRINRDPGRINPFYAPTSYGRELFQYIFLPVADFHPDDLALSPILIKEIPEAKEYVDASGNEFISYDITFKNNAKWSDGTPITNTDYAFTVKAIKHPASKATRWKPYFDFIKDVMLDPNDDKKLSIIMDKDYMLSKEAALTICIMPAHVFDADNKLSTVAVKTLTSDYEETDPAMTELIEGVNASMNSKTDVVQNGPYKLIDYQTDLYIVLERIEDYWGASENDNPFLAAGPKQIIFNVVPDELTAVTMAKEGKLDFLSMKQSQAFLDLKNDETFNKMWSFHVPQLMMFYYIAINNKSEILSDKTVRKALAHLTDVDDFIENIDGGLGERTVGFVHPTKSYYNASLAPIDFNIEKAKKLLSDDGWKDTNADGTVDKNGVELELDILITGSQLSKNIALLFQESAKQAGVKVGVTTKKTSLMRKENLATFNYDLAALAISNDANPDDPYSRWHSDNAVESGSNIVGYVNPEADKLIEKIRKTRDVTQRKSLYLKLQEIMYEDQLSIFLYCPLQKMIISNKFEAKTTAKRPGYKANTFRLAS